MAILASQFNGLNRILAPHALPPSLSPDTVDAANYLDVAPVLGQRRGRSRARVNPNGNIKLLGTLPYNLPAGPGIITADANGNWTGTGGASNGNPVLPFSYPPWLVLRLTYGSSGFITVVTGTPLIYKLPTIDLSKFGQTVISGASLSGDFIASTDSALGTTASVTATVTALIDGANTILMSLVADNTGGAATLTTNRMPSSGILRGLQFDASNGNLPGDTVQFYPFWIHLLQGAPNTVQTVTA